MNTNKTNLRKIARYCYQRNFRFLCLCYQTQIWSAYIYRMLNRLFKAKLLVGYLMYATVVSFCSIYLFPRLHDNPRISLRLILLTNRQTWVKTLPAPTGGRGNDSNIDNRKTHWLSACPFPRRLICRSRSERVFFSATPRGN